MPTATPISRVNDFVVRFANVNGSGSASANEMFARAVLRMGVPVAPRNIFPSNIQGLPTWYEVRVSEHGHLGARGGTDLMVAMNPQTFDRDIAGIEPGGYPEIADYELRRNLILEGLMDSVRRLDQLKAVLTYLPLSTSAMVRAATFWAQARRQGNPTADPKELDVDVILAAQAYEAGGIIVTENVAHLSRFVEARDWRDVR